MTDWEMYAKIQEHKRKGFNKSRTSRLLGKDYKTILKYWDMTYEEFAAEKENAGCRSKKADAYEDYVVETLREYPDMTAAQLYDWILELRNGEPLPFKERSFRDYVTNIRKTYEIEKPDKTRQYEAVDDPPLGYQAQVDMGEIILKTDTGRRKKVYCFGMVISNSRQKFVYWTEKPFTTESFIDAHQRAFAYYGGRTKEIVYDQDKILAVSENHGDIIYTGGFQAFISVVKFKIYLCRGADPESKGRVEAVVKYAKYGFAQHRIFHDIDTLNNQCMDWLERTANAKVHETTKRIPAEVFAIEKQYLLPVFDINHNHDVKNNISYPVRKDNVIVYKSNRYRVPAGTYEPGKKVYMIVEDDTVSIADTKTGEIYAEHPLCHDKGRLIGQKRSERDKSHTQKQLAEHTLKMLGGSDTAKEFLEAIHKEKPRYFRDQMGVIKNICLQLTDDCLIKSAIVYCMERSLYSAGDFKSAMLYLNELNNTSERASPPTVPKLPNKYRGMVPNVRDLSVYEDAMKGSVTNG